MSARPYCFSLPVAAFQCGNFLLNRDYQRTLKAKEYPEIAVQVLSLKENEGGGLTGKIKLYLVGKSKTLDNVNFTFQSHENKKALSAHFVFKASEFELKPPKRLGGILKTEDAMNITVELLLQ